MCRSSPFILDFTRTQLHPEWWVALFLWAIRYLLSHSNISRLLMLQFLSHDVPRVQRLPRWDIPHLQFWSFPKGTSPPCTRLRRRYFWQPRVDHIDTRWGIWRVLGLISKFRETSTSPYPRRHVHCIRVHLIPWDSSHSSWTHWWRSRSDTPWI